MVTIKYDGRLGNNIIQLLAGYVFAIKHNLRFESRDPYFEGFIDYSRCDGGDIGHGEFTIDDYNFIEYLEMERVERKSYVFKGFFQTKEFLEKYEQEIRSLLKVEHSYAGDRSVFLHYRIGDIMGTSKMMPVEYYEQALDRIDFDTGYISSDTIDHGNCQRLIEKYNLTTISMDPMQTILYGKNFKNIVLSEGTFSWWIGFLSRDSNIICSHRKPDWHGDIFFDRWKK